MSKTKILRVQDGDYRIEVQDGGEITLNTGAQTGTVRITGNLVVEGDNTTVRSENMVVKDNIIIINSGEQGSGVTLGTAGIRIDRGNLTAAQILFDESLTWSDPASATTKSGEFIFKHANGDELGIRTNSIKSGSGSINLEPTGSGYVKVAKANYQNNLLAENVTYPIIANRVLFPDVVPNKRYVDQAIYDAVAGLAPEYIASQDTQVITYDTAEGDPISEVTIEIDGVLKDEFKADQVNFLQGEINLSDVRISGNTITALNTNSDLILVAPGTGSVRIDDTLHITTTPSELDVTIDPAYNADGIKLYAKTPGTGKTGLFYVNSNNVRDEIISKNRSLLYSMIF